MNLSEQYQKLKNHLKEHPRIWGGAAGGLLLAGALGIWLSGAFTVYRLSEEFKMSSQAFPESTLLFVEIKNPTDLIERFQSTRTGRYMAKNAAWQNLRAHSWYGSWGNLSYALGLKAGHLMGPDTLAGLLGGSVGVGVMPDGSRLIVARTNLKSRIGIALAATMKGEEVAQKEKKQDEAKEREEQEVNSNTPVSSRTYTDLSTQERVDLDNLTVTRFTLKQSSLYIVMLEDFLFLSDDLQVLKQSLALATNPKGSSLASLKGMDRAIAKFQEKGADLLFYTGSKNPYTAPTARLLDDHSEGLAFVIRGKEKEITGEIYGVGPSFSPEKDPSRQKSSSPPWDRMILRDVPLSYHSNRITPRSYLASLEESVGDKSAVYRGLEGFIKASGVSDEISSEGGMAAIFHHFSQDRGPLGTMLYPELSFGFAPGKGHKKGDGMLLRAIFKGDGFAKESEAGIPVLRLRGTHGHYNPALGEWKESLFLSTGREELSRLIQASSGNTPVLSDLPSRSLLQEASAADSHLVLDLPLVHRELKRFFEYGEKESSYTNATLERDIYPLLEPLLFYSTLHIAYGLEGESRGRLAILSR